MLQINPAETFPIVRHLTDHTDPTTYYVRCVIKNAINDAVLDTLDLAEISTRYFRYNWKVVWDNTMARGRYITITTSVYTDSGYTTKSDNYGDEIKTYLIQERWDATKLQGIGGGADGLNTTDIRKELKKALSELVFPEQKELDTETLIKNITESVINNLHFPEFPKPKKVDLEPIRKSIITLSNEIKTRPKFEKTDLTQLSNSIQQLQNAIPKDVSEKLDIAVKGLTKQINTIVQKASEEKTVNLSIDASGKVNINDTGKKEKTDKLNKLKAKFGL